MSAAHGKAFVKDFTGHAWVMRSPSGRSDRESVGRLPEGRLPSNGGRALSRPPGPPAREHGIDCPQPRGFDSSWGLISEMEHRPGPPVVVIGTGVDGQWDDRRLGGIAGEGVLTMLMMLVELRVARTLTEMMAMGHLVADLHDIAITREGAVNDAEDPIAEKGDDVVEDA